MQIAMLSNRFFCQALYSLRFMLQAAAVARARLPLGHYSEEPAVQATLEVIAIEN